MFFQRRARASGNFSIEKMFDDIRAYLSRDIEATVSYASRYSNGFFSRIWIMIEAAFRQGDVNHVTGDVHFLTLLLNKQKTILTIHDCGFMKTASGLAYYILLYGWLRWPVSRSRWITVVSASTKRDLLTYVDCPPDKIKVVPTNISEQFTYTPGDFNEDRPVILQIGTAFNKNLTNLVKALEGVTCHLVVVGKLSEQQERLLSECRINYSNRYNLTFREIVEAYQSADIVTVVSTLEGFGMPIIEAQTVGRPVVTSNISSMPEVAGNGACLVDPFNIDAIKEGILKVVRDRDYRDKLVSAGIENAKKYKAEKIAHQYYQLYQEVYRANTTDEQV